MILFDYWGQGNSFSEDVPYSIPRFCDALTKIVDTLAIQRFHLMGISYGEFVALDYARLYQERLHTLTISDILPLNEELFEMYEELSLLFYRSGRRIGPVPDILNSGRRAITPGLSANRKLSRNGFEPPTPAPKAVNRSISHWFV